MAEHTILYQLDVPQEQIGNVMGKLSAIGALIRASDAESEGRFSFQAEVPQGESLKFVEWLHEATNEESIIAPIT